MRDTGAPNVRPIEIQTITTNVPRIGLGALDVIGPTPAW